MNVTCPYCGVVGEGPSDLKGNTLRCRSCQQVFTGQLSKLSNTANEQYQGEEVVHRSSFLRGFHTTWGVIAALGLAFGFMLLCIGLIAITVLGTSANKTFSQEKEKEKKKMDDVFKAVGEAS
jgi:hypothetical protein